MKKEEITLKNTKSEILNALNEALEREKKLSSLKYEPEKEEQKKQVQKAIDESKKEVEQHIFSDELNNKFKNLEMAIKAEEEKLKELYDIEKELNNIVIVVNAGKDYIAKIENEKKAKTEEINNNMNELEEKYKIRVDELEREYKEKSDRMKLERDREEEEYNYKLKREREIENNKWEDIKQKRENELEKKETEIDELLKEAQEKSEHIKELETKVEEIPSLMGNEYARGKTEATSEIEKENYYKIEMLKKEYENTINRQEDQITNLQKNAEKMNTEKELMQKKLDQAYTQIKEMATKTVEATGGVKIIGNNGNDNKC